ncbi:MAG: ribbon-helix-helix protein, CopG family [Luteolibacter sp.]
MGPIPVRLSPELQERVDTLAEKMSMTRSAVIRLAIRQWLDASEERELNPILSRDQEKGQQTRAAKSSRKRG